jgi:hypothetical protein
MRSPFCEKFDKSKTMSRTRIPNLEARILEAVVAPDEPTMT